MLYTLFLNFFKRFLKFIFREREKEGEAEGEKYLCERETSIGCLFYVPQLGTKLQPRHVPWLEIWPRIQMVNFCCAGWCPSNWATVFGAPFSVFNSYRMILFQLLLYGVWLCVTLGKPFFPCWYYLKQNFLMFYSCTFMGLFSRLDLWSIWNSFTCEV